MASTPTTRDAEGLQVDYDRDRASTAPEAAPYNHYGQYTPVAGKDEPYHAATQAAPPQQKVPFGLSVLNFGLLIALVTAIIVGGAVGGGLGGALASCNSSNSESTPAPTAVNECDQSNGTESEDTIDRSNYAALPANLVGNVTLICPKNGDNGTIRTTNGYKFRSYCGVNSPARGDGVVVDIVSIWAYHFDDCIGACAQMAKMNESGCDSVFFRRNMNVSTTQYGNCWLKTGKLKNGDEGWNIFVDGTAYAEVEEDDSD